MGLQLVTPAAAEPLDITAARSHLRVDVGEDDGLIAALIGAAREEAEIRTNRAFLTQTWKLVLDRFPSSNGAIEIPRPPLQAVNSITYIDSGGNVGTVDPTSYVVDAAAEPARVRPAWSRFWPPVILQTAGAVTVNFTAGWTDATKVPKRATQAMLLTIGNWYENREAVVSDVRAAAVELPQSAQALLWTLWTPPAENV